MCRKEDGGNKCDETTSVVKRKLCEYKLMKKRHSGCLEVCFILTLDTLPLVTFHLLSSLLVVLLLQLPYILL